MTSSDQKPRIYILAGPNGVGKTTIACQFLAEYVNCTEFLNADLIAAGLSPFAPESQNARASELLLERMDALVEERATFSFETTLAARSYRQRIIAWRERGFSVHLFFLWLSSAEMAIARVANRVRQGGGMDCRTQRFGSAVLVGSAISRIFTDPWSTSGSVLTAPGFHPG